MANVRDIFYVVQPGDSLSRIAPKSGGVLLPTDSKLRIARLLELNPHIKKPDFIFPGQLLRLGSTSNESASPSAADLEALSGIWGRVSAETKKIIQKNFDVLEWLSVQKDRLDFLDNFSGQGKPLLEAVPEMTYGVIPAEYRKFSIALRELTAIRGENIVILQRFRISVVREPILILTRSVNGTFKYAQLLSKMVEWAERVKLGRKLLFFEIGAEAGKVGVTAAVTGSTEETFSQFYRGAVKVGSGAIATKIAKQICTITVKKGPRGWLVCGLAFGVGIFGGQYVTGKMSDFFLGKPIDARLRELP